MARTPRVTFKIRTPPGFDHRRFADSVTNRLARGNPRRTQVHPDEAPGGAVGVVRVDASFDDAEEAKQFREWLRSRLGGAGGPEGRVFYHLCSHANGEEATEPCTQAPDFEQSVG